MNNTVMAGHAILAAGGNIGGLVGGLAPDWGPFGAIGTTGRTIIQVIMAAGVLLCMGTALLGASKVRLGQSNMGGHDTVLVDQGKKMVASGLIGVFLIGSLGTIFTIVYGLAI